MPGGFKNLLWFANEIVGFAGNVDFVREHVADPGWVGTMINFIKNIPTWASTIFMVIGFILIFYDSRTQKKLENKKQESDLIPLYEAAQKAYDALKNTAYGKVAYSNANGEPNEIITWFCYLIQPKVKIFGINPPAVSLETYSDCALRRDDFHFVVENNEVVAASQFLYSKWVNLVVDNKDLTKFLDSILTSNN